MECKVCTILVFYNYFLISWLLGSGLNLARGRSFVISWLRPFVFYPLGTDILILQICALLVSWTGDGSKRQLAEGVTE